MNTQAKHEESGCTDYLQHNWQSCPQNKPTEQHTAGPWQISNDGLIHNGNVSIAQILRQEQYESDDEANARLIVAAPELLKTLNDIAARANFMLVRNPQDHQADYILQQANNAIRKAENQ